VAEPPACYLGIDFGTSGARAAVVDHNGHILAEARSAYTTGDDPAAVWQATLFELIARTPSSLRLRLKAIAIDGTSGTVLLCDGDCRPLCPPLLYNDARAVAEASWLRGIATGCPAVHSPSSSLAKLLWLHKQPEFAHARHFLHQADWLAFLLHGRAGVSDYHNSLKLGYDVDRMAYPSWLRQLPVARLLPRVVAPGTPVGPILPALARDLGIPRDCVIRAGTTDSIAAFLASGANRPGQAVTSLGSTLVLKLLSETRVEAPEHGIYSHRFGNLWLAGGASNAGGSVLRKFFADDELERLSALIDPEASSGLEYYPLPAPGERFPVNDPHLEPRLSPRPADDARFLHAILEGLARIEAQGYRLLNELGATQLRSVRTAGGGAGNLTWTAIRRKLLGVPVEPADHAEVAYGCARLAAFGEKLLFLN
jgi:sugar (pentulose or hexulose) kinase